MAIAPLATVARRLAFEGYPADGSRALPRRIERVCTLLASDEYTLQAVAVRARVSHDTIERLRRQPLIKARIAHLRERLRVAAYDAEPLVDKRNRVVLAGALARKLHAAGESADWRDTLAVTKSGVEITGFDWRRTDQVRQLLDYIAKEVGDRSVQPSSTTVNVGISMDDAVTRVQALLSRLPDEDETPVAPLERGGGGLSADQNGEERGAAPHGIDKSPHAGLGDNSPVNGDNSPAGGGKNTPYAGDILEAEYEER